MQHKVFLMTLLPGQEKEYQQRHDQIWDELATVLKQHGVSNYSIHLHGTTELFAYAEIEDEARWNSLADEPIVKKWWAYMADIMETNPDNSPKSVDLNEMFYLA